MPTLDALRAEYDSLYAAARILPERSASVALAAHKVIRARARYEKVAAATGVPWCVIGIIHAREADCDFGCHLHNGDPLTARTHHVPAGRPLVGEPPFTWEDSAADALTYDKIPALGPEWDIAAALYAAEKVNGFGYRNKIGIRSPYLWGGTNHQQRGKYVADGRYDFTCMDSQPGAAAVLLAILAAVPDALGVSAPVIVAALDTSALETQPVAVLPVPTIKESLTAAAPTAPPAERPLAKSKSAWVLSLGALLTTCRDVVTGWADTLAAALPNITTDVESQLDSVKAFAGLLGEAGRAVLTPATLTYLSLACTAYAIYRLTKPRGA